MFRVPADGPSPIRLLLLKARLAIVGNLLLDGVHTVVEAIDLILKLFKLLVIVPTHGLNLLSK